MVEQCLMDVDEMFHASVVADSHSLFVDCTPIQLFPIDDFVEERGCLVNSRLCFELCE